MKKKKWPFVYVAVITVLTYIPILLTVVYSFNASKLTSVWEGFSLKWYRELFRDRDLGEALINSLILAVLSCAFAVLIGTSGALGMSRRKTKTGRCRGLCVHTPHHDPGDHSGHGIFVRIFPDGSALWYGHAGDRPYHVLCAVYVHDGKGETGGNGPVPGRSGAWIWERTKWQVFRDVILPQILPAILSGVLLAFAMSFDDVVISIFVTGPKVNTLPVKIYTKLKTGVTPEINALATVMLFVILLCLAGAYVLGRKSQTAVEKAAGGK